MPYPPMQVKVTYPQLSPRSYWRRNRIELARLCSGERLTCACS